MASAGREEALARLGITQDIYDELYDDFVVLAKDKSGLIGAACASGDWTQVGKLAHSVKGIAGNLGVDEVFTAARQVELDVKEGKTAETIQKGVAVLAQCVAAL
jgi:two-component system sensor histidine kinase/response regulator